ncbi:MAG: FAD-binding oxidoreductase [Bacteroidetes bacterium]|nr:MAG: FAD-binding oxidoreductase [Bacteroidota bacterium]
MSKTYDAIIIGAGIMGCCTAHELGRRGLSVAVLEKGHIGEGPTGDSLAIIRQHYSNRLTARMAYYGVRVFREFEDRIGGDCGFHQSGFIVLSSESNRKGLESNLAIQKEIGIDTRIISSEELIDLVPGIQLRSGLIAAFEAESGYADAVLTVKAYASSAKQYRVEVFEETEVTGISFSREKVSGVQTSGGEFVAPVVVNCAGAWGARIAAMIGQDIPIDACRTQVSIFSKPDSMMSEFPVVIDFSNGSFIRPYSEESVFGGLVEATESDAVVDPDNYERRADADFLNKVLERLRETWPDLKDSISIDGYASLYAITPDWHPIIDEVPAGSGFFICSGFSGHGFKLAPAVAQMTADMILLESDPMFDHQAFRLSRFHENDSVEGIYKYSILG